MSAIENGLCLPNSSSVAIEEGDQRQLKVEIPEADMSSHKFLLSPEQNSLYNNHLSCPKNLAAPKSLLSSSPKKS